MTIIRITRIFLQHGIHAHVAIDYCMIVGMYEFEVYDFQILGVGVGVIISLNTYIYISSPDNVLSNFPAPFRL